MKLQNRLMAMLSAIFFCAFALLVGIALWNKEHTITTHYRQSLTDTASMVERVMHAAMLAGQPETAQLFIKEYSAQKGLYSFNISRADGYAPFRDNKTIKAVNEYLGTELFKYRDEQPPLRVFEPADPAYQKAVEKGKETYLQEEINGKPLLTVVWPIRKQEECYQCHEEQERTRGIIRLSTDLTELNEEIYQARKWALVALITGLCITFFILKRSLRQQLFNPLQEIVASITEFGRGNLRKRISITTDDELTDIADSFNAMAGQLEESHATLEARVSERTEQLYQLNQWLEEEKSQMETLLNNMVSGVVYLDNDGKVTAVNNAARELLPQLAALDTHNQLTKLGNKDIGDIVNRLVKNNGESVELEIAPPDDPEHIYQVIISPVRSAQENTLGVMIIIQDISREKILRTQLIQAEKLSLAGYLVAEVAHEVNNCLHVILGHVELYLLTETISDKARKGLEQVLERTEQSARIIKRLMSLARKEKPKKVMADINQLIEYALELRSNAFIENSIEIVKELNADLPMTMADPNQLQSVFINIINNSIHEMTAADGHNHTLTVRSKLIDNTIKLSFKDTGRGIAPEHMRRIFDPFFTTKKEGEGTGLGLSLAFGIVKDHNGKLYALSQPGKGATFVIELPVVND